MLDKKSIKLSLILLIILAIAVTAKNKLYKEKDNINQIKMGLWAQPYKDVQNGKGNNNRWKKIWISDNRVHGLSKKEKELVAKSILIPLGENYFMRYPNILGEFNENNQEIRRIFQLAALSNDYEHICKLLVDLAERKNIPDLVRYRAYIGLSFTTFRAMGKKGTDTVRGYIKRALDEKIEKEEAYSDAYYLLGICEKFEGNITKALYYQKKAVNLDNSYLLAHWQLIKLISNKLVSKYIKSDDRLDMTAMLLTSIQAIIDLTMRKNDFSRLANELLPISKLSPEVALAVGYCYHHAGEPEKCKNILKTIIEKSFNKKIDKEIDKRARYILKYYR